MRKLFLLFAYDQYYPGGGWSDFVSAHETEEGAVEAAQADESIMRRDYVEVVSLFTLTVVRRIR